MGMVQSVLFFNGLYERQNVRRLNFGYRHGTDMGKDMTFETMEQMGSARRQDMDGLGFLPFKGDILEGIGFLGFSCRFYRLFMLSGVNAVRKKFFSFITLFACLFQGDGRIFPETEQLAFFVEAFTFRSSFNSVP